MAPSSDHAGREDSPTAEPGLDRAGFDPAEVKGVLSRYDLGQVRSVRPYAPGSAGWAGSPKARILCDKGDLLLKRRDVGGEDPRRVNAIHDLQLTLLARGFPAPRLLQNREGETALRLGERIYEVFEFVTGRRYDGSERATQEAGRLLARFHCLLADRPDPAPSGAPHPRMRQAEAAIRSLEAGEQKDPGGSLAAAFRRTRDELDHLGLDALPRVLIHGDWHPGNMLFNDAGVAAVIDYDSAGYGLRCADLGYGALQFSLASGGGDPKAWPAEPDPTRLAGFFRGYHLANTARLEETEIAAAPMLMVESLLAETAVRVAGRDRFAGMEVGEFLGVVLRKAEWLREHRDRVSDMLRAAAGPNEGMDPR